ncbi:hypothetical protein [Campylobacter aviculae]|uniref:Uncharacterized protein n=1 Tax=Campylobacter aviculae TaxID=2510190 RepID=A0A4V6DVG1_9BACT|nr:hypothetical protein [Campylobacter aviculae]TKX28112.1 hypothetical protein CQA76_08890 [Campylobacter aviculae]
MFKKLFSVATLGALLASSAFGDDFLAKVSNGTLSDNSAGVKVLNLNEMKDVKGGLSIRQAYHSAYVNSYGQRLNYTEYWQVLPDAYEEKIGAIKVLDTDKYSTTDYQSFKWFTSLDPKNEIVTIMGTYDFKTQLVYAQFIIYNTKTKTHRTVGNHPLANKIFNATKQMVAYYVYNNRYIPIR